MKFQHFCFFLCGVSAAYGCSRESDRHAERDIVSIQGVVQNLFAPDPGNNLATSESFTGGTQPLCEGPFALHVKIFDVVPFLLAPSTVMPLATCPVSPDDGTFHCENVDISDNTTALIAGVDDVNNSGGSDCVVNTAFAVVPCSTSEIRDADNDNCGNNTWIDDGVIDTANVGIPLFVVPQILFGKLEAETAALPGAGDFGPMLESGAVLGMYVGPEGPAGGIKPYMPEICRSGTAGDNSVICRSFVVGIDGDGLPSIFSNPPPDPELFPLTLPGMGMWLGQLVVKDAGGDDVAFQASPGDLMNPLQGYAGVDCSAADPRRCYGPTPGKPVRAGERGEGTPGVLYINFIATAGEVAAGVCPLEDALSDEADKDTLLACP